MSDPVRLLHHSAVKGLGLDVFFRQHIEMGGLISRVCSGSTSGVIEEKCPVVRMRAGFEVESWQLAIGG